MNLPNKKRLLNRLASSISTLFDRKKNIIFVSRTDFHAQHLIPIVSQLANDDRYRLFVVGEFHAHKLSDKVNHCDSYDELPFWRHYHLCLLTGMNLPWQVQVKTVFFGHGIGPKLNYQTHTKLTQFNYIFAPCLPFYQSQKKLGPELVKAGLPILDKQYQPNIERERLIKTFALDSNKAIVCFAPSWNADNTLISDLQSVMNKLANQSAFNVIVSPHPNLLNSDTYEKAEIFQQVKLALNHAKTGFSTLEVCSASDIVISDISSILYESLALRKCVLFDGNQDMYHQNGASEVLSEMQQALPTLQWDDDLGSELASLYKHYDEQKAQAFIRAYLFNTDQATAFIVDKIGKIVDLEPL